MAKGEIAHNEQFLHLPQRFQHYSIIKLSFLEIFYILDLVISKYPAADLLYVGTVYKLQERKYEYIMISYLIKINRILVTRCNISLWVHVFTFSQTLSHLQTLFYASAADKLCEHGDKMRNYS